MQHTLPLSRLGPFDTEANPALNVVIIYEDFDTGKQAKKTFDLLVQDLGSACRLTNQMWNFDVLTIHELRDIALKDAAQADIIIVSCHGNDLLQHVKSWIETALAESCNVLALIALFNKAPAKLTSPASARSYLAKVARQARVEFFAQPGPELTERRPDQPVCIKRNAEMIAPVFTPLTSVIHQEVGFPRWGINE